MKIEFFLLTFFVCFPFFDFGRKKEIFRLHILLPFIDEWKICLFSAYCFLWVFFWQERRRAWEGKENIKLLKNDDAKCEMICFQKTLSRMFEWNTFYFFSPVMYLLWIISYCFLRRLERAHGKSISFKSSLFLYHQKSMK